MIFAVVYLGFREACDSSLNADLSNPVLPAVQEKGKKKFYRRQ